MAAKNSDNDNGGFCGVNGWNCPDPDSVQYTQPMTSDSYKVSVSTSCSLGSSTSGMGGVSSGANSGVETRPINMKVMYVIRVY